MTGYREPLVSIVVPAYNEELHVGQCIESVLSQTHANWDLTIVNNCSTDRTSAIARKYADKDSRIRIVDNPCFVPVVANYNAAIRQVSPHSAYCKVIGADDRLFPSCLESMVQVAEQNPSVAIVGSYGLEGDKLLFDGIPETETVIPGREICRRTLLGGPYVFGAQTNVLYRSDIVRSRRNFYNERNLHSDAEVCYEFLQWHDFGFVHRVLTFQRLREGSITSYACGFNTYVHGHLYVLLNYGSVYLSESEKEDQLRRWLHIYHWYLGEQFFAGRDRDFWAYHRGKSAELGYPLTTPRLAADALRCALYRIRHHPADIVRALMRRLGVVD